MQLQHAPSMLKKKNFGESSFVYLFITMAVHILSPNPQVWLVLWRVGKNLFPLKGGKTSL